MDGDESNGARKTDFTTTTCFLPLAFFVYLLRTYTALTFGVISIIYHSLRDIDIAVGALQYIRAARSSLSVQQHQHQHQLLDLRCINVDTALAQACCWTIPASLRASSHTTKVPLDKARDTHEA